MVVSVPGGGRWDGVVESCVFALCIVNCECGYAGSLLFWCSVVLLMICVFSCSRAVVSMWNTVSFCFCFFFVFFSLFVFFFFCFFF